MARTTAMLPSVSSVSAGAGPSYAGAGDGSGRSLSIWWVLSSHG